MMKDKMIELRLAEFAENYLEKVYYFCLKRTNGSHDAEDLASDISLNIVAALDGGVVPENFSAWVWRIARNRYSVWADSKRRYRESVAGTDIGDCEIACEDDSAEDGVIHAEQLALLRRELAFISSDYRDIVVSYYIQDRKIQDIAASAGLSQGTVKSKLFRARKKLKEGMDMAREFGQKSFKPEEVDFTASGNQPSGLPWKALRRKLPKNILLEASGNPSTIEELAIELGTAIPYMEEEVGLLVEATLLKEVDGKYVTDFFILDKETRLNIYGELRKGANWRSEVIGMIASDSLPFLKELGVVPRGMGDNEVRWWIVMSLAEYCVTHSKAFSLKWPAKRSNGETWGIMGYEKVNLPENCALSGNGVGDLGNMFAKNETYSGNMWNRPGEEMSYVTVQFLLDVLREGRKRASFSHSEQGLWNAIENRIAHADESGNIVPDIPVIYSDDMEKIEAFWENHPLYGKLTEKMEQLFGEVTDILKKNANPILHEQLPYCVSSLVLDCRMMALNDEVNSGKLIIPGNLDDSRIGMWIEMKR